MNSFLDITIVESDKSLAMKMNALFNQILGQMDGKFDGDVAIAFPQMTNTSLGNTLRLHGSKVALKTVRNNAGVSENSELIVEKIKPCPPTSVFRSYSRKQRSFTKAKLRSLIKKSGASNEGVAEYKSKINAEKALKLPFLVTKNNHCTKSKKDNFRIHIAVSELTTPNPNTSFNKFGLSQAGATVPHF